MMRKICALSLILMAVLMASGCALSHNDSATANETKGVSVQKSEENKHSKQTTKKIVATSMATVDIMAKLNVDLIGVPHSEVDQLPDRYKGLPEIGSPMNPDAEILASLRPDLVLSPSSLISDLLPKYENLNLDYGFLNLNNVAGMYQSIYDLGELLDRREEAGRLINEYKLFMEDYNERHKDLPRKKVLILMGLPGSYVVATAESYAGSLVEMAGGENVYSSDGQPFLNINVEDMLKKDPDVILRTAHAMPEEVKEMFAKDFNKNPNWKHFRAVKEGNVYDLNHQRFGMSAKFNYPDALADLEVILYGKA